MAIPSIQVEQVAQLLGGKHADISQDVEEQEESAGTGSSGELADAVGESGAVNEAAAQNGPQADEAERPYTLKELAAKLEVPAKSLYELEIPIGDGEHASLGAIKDGYKAGQAAIAEVEQVRGQWEDRERELMVERHQLGRIVQSLPNLPPQVVEMMREQEAQTARREREATLRAIPAWAKAEVYEADARLMLEFLKQYGFGKRDLDSIGDHRLVKLLYDQSKGWAKAKALKSDPTVRHSARAGQNAPASRAAPPLAGLRATIERAKNPQATRSDKLAGISALLR